MNRFIYSFALVMLAIMPVSAQEDSVFARKAPIEAVSTDGATGSSNAKVLYTSPDIVFADANFFDIQYTSKNVKNEKVTLSARVYVPNPWLIPDNLAIINHVILSCHPTVTSNFEAPTGTGPIDGEIKRMCGVHNDDGYANCYMIVCPDYCGYGVSSYIQHPYLIHDITAANCIDAVRAAVNEVSKTGRLRDWDLDIIGYSQGGATALACTKYLHTNKENSDLLDRLRQTICGDGPYSAVETVKQYIEWGIPAEYGGLDRDLEYPCIVPLIIQSAKEAYGDGCMKTVDTESYFTQEFLDTGIFEMIKAKVTNTNDLNNELMKKMPRRRPVDLFSDKVINPDGTLNETTNEYKCLFRAFEKGDLTTGWTPTKPLTFYHLPNDGVVPYANFQAAKDGFKEDNKNIRFIEARDAHKGDDTFSFVCMAKCLRDPDFEMTSHADGGTLFYLDYMFGSVLRKGR